MSGDRLIFFGHHKCASRYFRADVFAPICRALGYDLQAYAITSPPFRFRLCHELDLYNIDFESFAAAPRTALNLSNAGAPVVARVRALGVGYRGLHVIRDPRQILVSNYFHHLRGHNTVGSQGWVWEKLIEDRANLERLSFEDGLLYELGNITRDVLENQIFAWRPEAQTLDVRLEDFARDPQSGLERIAVFLGLNEARAPSGNAARFANPESRPWRECLPDRVKSAFKKRYGEALIRIGYEANCDW